ncbi:Lrp/AsnC family transcriptional regulator [Promethearchaeum syntrophicum]|uniref:Lrp/AsnC family transcriptional regulator n=1 Tax=Promethearchaeum syntrophicum TaxID=2594042 RepID=A0A5B9DFU7_9ARCH|nr:Lrp/AsnC family transcriptional regulator [Candidatus Prometheoarchaeum syntrophicum]QEE17606.1 putative HTH-type transcriptional regulator [Candidatus Prometheoarchaeum syntrophicum]
MTKTRSLLDETDKKILNILQKDCTVPLNKIAKLLDISKSTVHYRMKRLKSENIIEGYHAKVNFARLGDDFQAIIHIRAKYSKNYVEKVGKELAKIQGVWAIYNVLGDNDFIIMVRAINREELMNKLEEMRTSNLIERTNTVVIARILKEEERLFFETDIPQVDSTSALTSNDE